MHPLFLLHVVAAPYETTRAWLASPGNAVAMVLLLATGFVHLSLGLQVIVEDYVHDRRLATPLLMAVPVSCATLTVIGIYAVLHVALAG